MEIRLTESEVIGVIPTADIVEGRMVLLTTHAWSYDFGSQTDLPGAKVPATADEAKKARYVIGWSVDQRKPPYYQPTPSYTWSMRQGFGNAANSPFATTVYLTYPGYTEGATIPSGVPSLAYGRGVYTVPSGAYIYSASIAKGASLIVANTAEDTTDAGKLKYQATYDDRVVAIVEHIDSTTGKLTFRMEY
jgi:hypothetical protein